MEERERVARVDRTFQALGAINNASSRLNTACEDKPWDWYSSASSHQASASVGKAFKKSIKLAIARACLPNDFKRLTRRFRIGYMNDVSKIIEGKGIHTDHINRVFQEQVIVFL